MNDKQLLNPLYLWYSVWKLPKKSLRMTFLTRPGLSQKKKAEKREETRQVQYCSHRTHVRLLQKSWPHTKK